MKKEQIENLTSSERSSLDQKRTDSEKELNDGGAEYLYDANKNGERLTYVTENQIENSRALMNAEMKFEELKRKGLENMSPNELIELGKLLIKVGENEKTGLNDLPDDVVHSRQEDEKALLQLRQNSGASVGNIMESVELLQSLEKRFEDENLEDIVADIPKEYLKDRKFIFKFLSTAGTELLNYVPKEYLSEKTFLLEAAGEVNDDVMAHADKSLQDNPEFAIKMILKNERNSRSISDQLKHDETFLKDAIFAASNNSIELYSLMPLPKEFSDNRDFIMELFRLVGSWAYEYMGDGLEDDEELFEMFAGAGFSGVLRRASDKLSNDPEFVLSIIEKIANGRDQGRSREMYFRDIKNPEDSNISRRLLSDESFMKKLDELIEKYSN
jgi:hypothetical protein